MNNRRQFIKQTFGAIAGLAVLPIVSKAGESSGLCHLEGEHVSTEYLYFQGKPTVLDQIIVAINCARSKDFQIDYIRCQPRIMNELIFESSERDGYGFTLHPQSTWIETRVFGYVISPEAYRVSTADLTLYCGDIRLAFDIEIDKFDDYIHSEEEYEKIIGAELRRVNFPEKYIK